MKTQNDILFQSKSLNIPILRDTTSAVLSEIIKKIKPQDVLEIGTGIGYSAMIFLLDSNCKLVSLEKDKVRYELAKSNLDTFVDRIELINDDAKNFLIKHYSQKYDFIFLDSSKGQYIKYLPYLTKLLKPKGILFCDNVLFKKGYDKHGIEIKRYKTINKRLKDFLEEIFDTNIFVSYIYDVDDGFSISIKK